MQALPRPPATVVASLPSWSPYDSGVHPGIAIERVRYAPDGGPVAVRAPVQVVANPLAAVRAIRVDIRDSHVFTMTRHETTRALERVDSDGWLQAVAALYRGEATGFTITLRDGTCAEWRLRPVRHTTLTAPPSAGGCKHRPQ